MRDGVQHRFYSRLGDIIDALWPYGAPAPSVAWPTLRREFKHVNQRAFRYTTDAGVTRQFHPVLVSHYPVNARDDTMAGLRAEPVYGYLTLPPGSHVGPSTSKAVLRHAGSISGPALAAALAWAFYRGQYLTQQSKRTAPTIPRAQCDDRGRVGFF